MATIVTRAGKGSPLTNTEVDANFTNLNAEKLEGQIGTAPDQVPVNGLLGGMAYQSPESVVIKPQATAVPNGIGDMIFQATSNSVIEMEYKGSDAIVRTAQIPLSNERLAEISRVTPLAQAVRVAMTSATSGSNGIQVLNDADINMGTNDFTVHWEGSLPDWTPSGSGSRGLVGSSTGAGIAGFRFNIDESPSGILILLLRNTVSTITLDSTVAVSLENEAFAKVTASVIRETAASAGSVTFYVNGVQLGNSVAITAGTPISVSSLGSLYISGSNTERTSSNTTNCIIYNRALTAAEVLSLSVNGPALADIGASQTVLNTSTCVNGAGANAYGTFSGASATGFTAADATGGAIDKRAGTADEITIVAGRTYRIAMTLVVNSGQRPNISVRESMTAGAYAGATNDTAIPANGIFDFVATLSGTFVVYFRNTLASDFVVSDLNIKSIGITGQWNAADAQSNTGQIFDSSGNKNHALLPAAGATIIGRPTSQQRQVRWTNTWAGTNELQYIGGVNQAILPANAYIESIVGTVSGATVEDIIVGDGSDTDRYVTITTGLATGTTSFTLANRTTDGTNLKLTVDPDTNATMSIAWVITYTTLE